MLILADAHVHVHRCFERSGFLDAAVANFERGGVHLGLRDQAVGCLFLTEGPGEGFFQEARRSAGPTLWGSWRFERTEEENSLWACRDGTPKLILVAGQQVVTQERLEVLALGLTRELPQGRTMSETLDLATAHQSLAVIPWGFGKWWGSRGRLVRSIVESAQPGSVFLGDNGGRPRLSRRPRLLRLAERRGLLVLPGSDPLPFGFEAGKVGRYGFVIECDPAREKPAAALIRALREARTQPRTFGRRETLLRFCRSQLAIQLRNRTGWYSTRQAEGSSRH
jgi:hypothetical protein